MYLKTSFGKINNFLEYQIKKGYEFRNSFEGRNNTLEFSWKQFGQINFIK